MKLNQVLLELRGMKIILLTPHCTDDETGAGELGWLCQEHKATPDSTRTSIF